MASHPPGPCCMQGFKHEGEPAGELLKIGETPVYFMRPTQNKYPDTAIIYLSDIFGISHNGKLLADEFARHGYLTLYPDLVYGDTPTLEDYHSGKLDINEWTSRHGPETVDPVIENTITYLRDIVRVKKIGGVGYCFGGKYVARFLKNGKLDSGYSAHPSLISDEELAAVQKPFSIAAAEDDPIFPPEKRFESEKILRETNQRFQINLFSGVSHGFAVRGDLSLPAQEFAQKAAFLQAVTWFHYTL